MVEINFEAPEWLELSFGTAFRKIRRNEGLSMKELSEESKVSQSYISQLENDVRLPSEKVIHQLSAALAKGKRYDDPFGDGYYYSYESDFILETREQDFNKLLLAVRNANETKQKQEDFISQIGVSGDKIEMALSSEDVELLKKFIKLDKKSQRFVLNSIDFLLEKNSEK